MATTTAKISIISTDLVSNTLDLTTVMTLYTGGTTTGVDRTTGLARYSTVSTSEIKLLEAGDYDDNKPHKLYLKNTSTTRTHYVNISIGTAGSTVDLGRIYGGEWCLVPWDGTEDLHLTQSATGIINEWMLFYE